MKLTCPMCGSADVHIHVPPTVLFGALLSALPLKDKLGCFCNACRHYFDVTVKKNKVIIEFEFDPEAK